MTKKKKVVLWTCLVGGVVVAASTLIPTLTIPVIYKINLKSFVQTYTPVRNNEEYTKLEGKQPNAKLLFFSMLYYIGFVGEQDPTFAAYNFKVNGLHNKVNFTISDGSETHNSTFSYSDDEVKGDSIFMQLWGPEITTLSANEFILEETQITPILILVISYIYFTICSSMPSLRRRWNYRLKPFWLITIK